MTRHAIITPSYRGDIERCRLLCASIDTFVSHLSTHYLLVEDQDVALFRTLEGPKRRIVAESELLPSWLKARPDPLSFGRRRVWTGAGALLRGVPPLRGWHTQQLRKLAFPRIADEDLLLFADADVIFLRPLDLDAQLIDGKPRLYRLDGGIRADMARHATWVRHARAALGLQAAAYPENDYINNLVTWTRAHARGLLDHIETVTGRDWTSAVASRRDFSEWLLYGLYVDQVIGPTAGLQPTSRCLARTYWSTADVGREEFVADDGLLEPDQVAIGVQSFIGVPIDGLWELFRRHAGGLRTAPYATAADSA